MFWLIAIILSLGAGAFILQPLFAKKIDTDSESDSDVAFYKAQLSEVDVNLGRGLISKQEAADLRLDLSKQLLAADANREKLGATDLSRNGRIALAVGILAAVLGGGFVLYENFGANGMADQPLLERRAAIAEARPTQAEAEARANLPTIQKNAEIDALVEKLRNVLETRPTDLDGRRLLAQQEAKRGKFVAAYQAQEDLLKLLGDTATASDYGNYAEYLIFAAGGIVSPKAERALTSALSRDPSAPRPRYYSGLAMAQTGRLGLAEQIWRGLIADSPANAPWISMVQSDLAKITGETVLSGPSPEDIEAASELRDTERAEMIQNMVAGLAQRLASEGGNAQEWARLIRALGVLGETAEASKIWNEAKTVFANDATALSILREAAQDAQVAQ